MVTRLHEKWRAVPLSGRLVVIIAGLLLLGLAAISAATLGVLRVHLIGQVDDRLRTESRQIAEGALLEVNRGRADEQFLPSDFVVVVQGQDQTWTLVNPDIRERVGLPRVAPVDPTTLPRDPEPRTLQGDGTHVRWRAVALPVHARGSGPDDDPVGAVVVALPLHDTDHTIKSTARLLVLAGLGIAALGGVAASLAVRRSLRPLREIEETAGAIAAGDLSRRVPTPPPTTEVGSLARSLNVMLAQIEQSFAARAASERRMRQFVSDASHELRTPLSTIRGYGELYRMGGVQDVRQAMGRIESEARRMGNLVEDLLQLARLDEGRPLTLGRVDLTSVASDAVADLHAQAPDRTARVVPLTTGGAEASGPPGPVIVTADADRVRQVVANLVGNVLQHTPAGTPVELAVGHPEPGWALLEVRDHGPGIRDEDAAKVFERFYRVDPSRARNSGGTGLGLAIVAAVVGSHGGGVRVLPTPGGGATVQVALPVDGPEQEPETADQAADDHAKPAAAGGSANTATGRASNAGPASTATARPAAAPPTPKT